MVECNKSYVESSRAKYSAMVECGRVKLGQLEPSRVIAECSRAK